METKDTKPKLLIDMDIGDDIDDAFALYFAMRLGYEIVGITTVFRNTVERARITKKLLADFGRGYESVPVYAGHGVPLAETAPAGGYPHLCQYSPEIDDPKYDPDGTDPDAAVDFIISACEKYGRELTVIAIGPFTNMARVIEKDPAALGKAKEVAIMGGAFFKQYADWNVICDVEAAAEMFRHVPNLHCMGADVTHQLDIGEEHSQHLLSLRPDDPAAAYVLQLHRLWRPVSGRRAMLHDPLVILYAGEPAVCRMEEAAVEVMTDGPARGMTLNVDAYHKAAYNPYYKSAPASPKARVAADVDREYVIGRFMKEFG